MYCSSVVPAGSATSQSPATGWWGKGCAAQCRDRVNTEGSPEKMASVPSPCAGGGAQRGGGEREQACLEVACQASATAVGASSLPRLHCPPLWHTPPRHCRCTLRPPITTERSCTQVVLHPLPGARPGLRTRPAQRPRLAAPSAPPPPGRGICTSLHSQVQITRVHGGVMKQVGKARSLEMHQPAHRVLAKVCLPTRRVGMEGPARTSKLAGSSSAAGSEPPQKLPPSTAAGASAAPPPAPLLPPAAHQSRARGERGASPVGHAGQPKLQRQAGRQHGAAHACERAPHLRAGWGHEQQDRG